jgi:5'-nucleotidase
MNNILISHPQDFNQKLKNIIAWGKEHFHVIADFDRTLTKANVNDKPRPSLLQLLEQQWSLGVDFNKQSQKNFEKYSPIEINPNIAIHEKKEVMHEWWTVQFDLMLKSGLTKNMIISAMKSDTIGFRSWYEGFFDILKNNTIPLLILSATGLWYESIYYSLEKVHKLSDNIEIISNAFVRDKEGRAIAIREPIIHSFNKDETIVKELSIYEKIKDRKNILLLGDGLWDTHMADGFDYENIIKIWFLNNDTPENREKFQEKYDLIILDDGPMDEVNEILRKILK